MTANEIKEKRLNLKISQESFAHLLGVTYGTVNRWENGHSKPSPLALERMKEILNRGQPT